MKFLVAQTPTLATQISHQNHNPHTKLIHSSPCSWHQISPNKNVLLSLLFPVSPPNLNRCLSSSDTIIDTKQKHTKEVTYTKLVNLNALRELTDSYLPQLQTSRLTFTRKSMVLNSKSTTKCKRIHTSSC